MEKRHTPARHPGDAPAAGTCDFDRPIDRRGTNSVKYDTLAEHFGRGDLLPMWVADMDFETPDFIVGALRRRLEHPLYGYTAEPADYRPAITDWIRTHHGWEVRGEWIAYIPGIVKGIGLVIDRFVGKDEKVIIQPPVHHPFRLVPEGNGRQVVLNPLREHRRGLLDGLRPVGARGGRPMPPAAALQPAQPGRHRLGPGDAGRLAAFCDERGILVVSDEIHCDMALWDNRHTPFASVSEAAARCSITFGAPTKTFNIAGIVSSYAIVPDETLRNRFFRGSRPTNSTHPTSSRPSPPSRRSARARHGGGRCCATSKGTSNWSSASAPSTFPPSGPAAAGVVPRLASTAAGSASGTRSCSACSSTRRASRSTTAPCSAARAKASCV